MELEDLDSQYKQIIDRMGMRYFDRQGKPLDLMEWARILDNDPLRIVAQEIVGRYFVSTVWVGLNMNLFGSTPLIFETMIFLANKEDNEEKNPLAFYQERYETEEQAFKGHEEAMAICRAQILIEKGSAMLEQCQAAGILKDSQSEELGPSA